MGGANGAQPFAAVESSKGRCAKQAALKQVGWKGLKQGLPAAFPAGGKGEHQVWWPSLRKHAALCCGPAAPAVVTQHAPHSSIALA